MAKTENTPKRCPRRTPRQGGKQCSVHGRKRELESKTNPPPPRLSAFPVADSHTSLKGIFHASLCKGLPSVSGTKEELESRRPESRRPEPPSLSNKLENCVS